jgi:NitT/TauT family transport system substrate-binding protein
MGRVHFAVENADQVLLARKEGADLVAVMAVMQDSPRCIMVHEKSGIRSLADLHDITLAIGEGNPFAEFLKSQLPLDNVRIVSYSGSIAKFLVDDQFAQQGYVFSEPIVARQRGADPLPLMVSELGFNPYTGLVLTHRDLIEQQPELVRKFVRATIRGWQRFLQDPQTANAEIHRLNPEMDAKSLAQAVDVVRKLCLTAGSDVAELGKMVPARWEKLARQLEGIELLPTDQKEAWAKAFTTEFLP